MTPPGRGGLAREGAERSVQASTRPRFVVRRRHGYGLAARMLAQIEWWRSALDVAREAWRMQVAAVLALLARLLRLYPTVVPVPAEVRRAPRAVDPVERVRALYLAAHAPPTSP